FQTIDPGDDRWVIDTDLSPDGKRVITGSKDGYLRMFDATTTQEIGEPIKIDGAVCATNFSQDSKRFLTIICNRKTGQNVAQVWDGASRERLGPTIPLANYVVVERLLEFGNAGFVSSDILLVQTSPTILRFYKPGTDKEVWPAIESAVPITIC